MRSTVTSQRGREAVFYKTEFRGVIMQVSPAGDYAFVGRDTISRTDGEDLGIDLKYDLRLHVKKNRGLGEPLPKNVMIYFFLQPHPNSLDGIEIIGAQLA